MTAAPPFLGVAQSLTGRFWRPRALDERTALALAQKFALPEIVGRVLAARGVGLDIDDGFFNPSLKAVLPDPSEFLDMDRAAERLARAILDGEEVAVFGDYDVDGATSSALLKRFFDAAGGRLHIYIPDRMAEGYGPNAPALLRLRQEGVSLVVTVDCGVMAFDALAAAEEAGLEVVVIDHHQAEPRLPRAVAVVNPNRLDESSPHRQLAAVGLTFMLVVAVNRALRQAGWYQGRAEPALLQWLDLVALGTVCDVVPLTGLNRALVAQGLKVMAGRRNLGLATLADVAGAAGRPGPFLLGYILGPRVNAGGRVGRADLGARLLTTADPDEAVGIAQQLDRLNAERREIEASVQDRALDQVVRTGQAERPLILVAEEGWHAGVVGIVASRLKDRYRRPAFVIALDGGIGKGSGRSVPGVDLGSAVTAAKQAGLLLNGGGHAMAAGLTVEAGRLDALAAFLAERIAPQLAEAPGLHSLGLDGALAVAGATPDLCELLDRVGPYGAGHPEPRFAVPSALVAKADIVGADHVRVFLKGRDGGRLKAIAFRAAGTALGRALLQSQGAPLHVAGHLRVDEWGGRRGVQLMVEDAAFVHRSGDVPTAA